MALGDCTTYPCASPLDFESLLIDLFGTGADGCIGIKAHLDIASDLEEPCVDMTLQELIASSLVEDGAGGYALRMLGLIMATPVCYPCADNTDIVTLLKSLFAKQGDCYGMKYYAPVSSCSGITSYDTCAAQLTADQLIRHAIGHDDTYGNYLLINQLSGTCDPPDCLINMTMDQALSQMVVKVDGECYGAVNLLAVDNNTVTALKDCGLYFTFEDVFRAATTEVVCGTALNIILISREE